MTSTTSSCSTSATTGRASASETTQGALEQNDLREVVDWLDRRKGPQRIALMGVSMGGAAALAESIADDRIAAVILDSTHATAAGAIQARLDANGYPLSLPGSWSALLGSLIRTGEDISAVDPVQRVAHYANRPLLIIEGGTGRPHRSTPMQTTCWPRPRRQKRMRSSRSACRRGMASRSRRVPASTATGC